jgi:hypothetical protein
VFAQREAAIVLIEAEIFWKMDLYRREEQQELQHEMADTDLRARP